MGGGREPPRRTSNAQVNGDNREALRQLLCDLRKDAMDDDLENNDGTFFPCEFCGDPYPVEYLMRHQVISVLIMLEDFEPETSVSPMLNFPPLKTAFILSF